jgi:hypothetical protein
MYKKITSVAQKRGSDHIILKSSNETKALWKVINKESGRGFITIQTISLEPDSMSVTNMQHLPYKFNAYFVDSVDRLLNLNDDKQACSC